MSDPTDPGSSRVEIDPARVLAAMRARFAQQMARQAEEIVRLVEEISHLEAYIAQTHAAPPAPPTD